MIKFIFATLMMCDFVVYRYSGIYGVSIFTLGFFVAWLSVFGLALFGGESVNWESMLNAKR